MPYLNAQKRVWWYITFLLTFISAFFKPGSISVGQLWCTPYLEDLQKEEVSCTVVALSILLLRT